MTIRVSKTGKEINNVILYTKPVFKDTYTERCVIEFCECMMTLDMSREMVAWLIKHYRQVGFCVEIKKEAFK